MRLVSLRVRRYRLHQDSTVVFDPARNLIGGPNESGKSTLVQAAHRALFLRAKTGGALQKEMVSTLHLGDPEVTLVFESGGARWELEKRFAGSSRGSTLLTGAGLTLKDDEAESKLAELLRRDPGAGRVTANQLPEIWSHLWVWQGSSGADPTAHASEHKDSLVQRLQHEGIAAVMQSDADQRARERVAGIYETLFTQATGKARAGSPPELARTELITATEELQRARDSAARLESLVEDHVRAERQIAEADGILPALREQKSAVEVKLATVKDLRLQEDARLRAAQTSTAAREQLEKHDAILTGLHEQVVVARKALLPAEEQEAVLIETERTARESATAATASHRTAADAVRQARLRYDLAAAVDAALGKTTAHEAIAERSNQAAELRSQLTTLRAELARHPAVTAKNLDGLRQLERDSSQAGISLDAMATGIELLAADRQVTLDGEVLSPGAFRILTDSVELTVGDGTRLRIRPGGGNSLSDARTRAEAAARRLRTALDQLSLTDLTHAASVHEQRQSLENQIVNLDTRWKALGGEGLAGELTAAQMARETSVAEVKRRHEALGAGEAPPSPANPIESQALVAAAQESLRVVEQVETETRGNDEQARARLESAGRKLQDHRTGLSAALQAARDLDTRITVLEDTHGNAIARAEALGGLRIAEQDALARLAEIRDALTALSPELLEADLERFQRSIVQQETRHREGENARLVARAQLVRDGSTDPQADLLNAAARLDHAREVHSTAERRAKAIELLHGLFNESREAIDRSLVQPLADRITGYLRCLFGPSAEVRVKVSESGIEGLELFRAEDSNFGFEMLSGGAREQVAAAVRLALAEILAANHDGCLPIVFDDAFAYTDPERVQSLQRMLDLAARRGLQVILLSCTPLDYSALGALELSL